MSVDPAFIPLEGYRPVPDGEMLARARAFYETMNRRRTVRTFSDRPVPRAVIEDCLRAASTAPSGAHRQPWHFVVVSDLDTRRKIRQAAEQEERAFYTGRAPDEWLEALRPLGTDEHKPFLERAPWLIAVFAQTYQVTPEGKRKNYYVNESVGIATGMLVTALHQAGLATLTHTPSPMGFLRTLLGRPEHERPFLLLVVGVPEADTTVPALTRKPLSEIATFL